MSTENGVNSAQEKPVDETPLMIFQGPGCFIQMPTNWLIVNGDDGTIAFIGPTVGVARAGFTITLTSVPEVEGRTANYLAIAESTKSEQATTRANYTVLNEQELSTDAFTGLMRYFHWFNPDIDMVLVQRQIFAANGDTVYTLTSTVPNSDHLDEFDRLFVKMISSFRYGSLNL